MRNLNDPAILIVLLSLLMSGSISCSRRGSDNAIAKDIQDKVAADPDTRESQVSVAAKDGKVTLSGTVNTPAAQQKIEEIAHGEPGAMTVDDQTTLQPAMTPASKPATQSMATPAPAPEPPPPPPPPPKPIVVHAGTVLTVRTVVALSSKTSQTGQTFLATLAQPVSVGGRGAFPAGATISGEVVTAKAKGKIKGEGELSLTLKSISVRGRTYRIQTNTLDTTVKGKGKRTAVTTGGGAAGGALIGGIAGGGKGTGIGALLGAGAGLAGGALTGNQQIEIPAESALSFTLAAPVTIPPGAE